MKIEKWRLSDLRESPHQESLFQNLSKEESEELKASMDAGGLRYPIEIRPDGEIVDGHQRFLAAQALGWEEIDVLVRDDLEHADESTIQTAMIASNLQRRQLRPLEIARLYLRMKEIEQGRPIKNTSHREQQDLRDKLAAKLGTQSGRTLDRYVRLLRAPRAVQDAVSLGKLDVTRALRVVGHAKQEIIAEEIGAGCSPKEVVNKHAPPEGRPSLSYYERYKRLVACLKQHVDALHGHEYSVVGKVMEPDDANMLLTKAIVLLGSLLEKEVEVAEGDGAWEYEDEEEQ